MTVPEEEPARRSRTRWLPALAFVLGLVLGAVVVGLLGRSSLDQPTAVGSSSASPTLTGSTPSAVSSADPSAGAQVNAACLRVIDDAREVHDVLAGVGEATADVDLQRLDDMVRELQPIEPRLGKDLRDCRVDARLGASTSTGAPSSSRTEPPTPIGTPSR